MKTSIWYGPDRWIGAGAGLAAFGAGWIARVANPLGWVLMLWGGALTAAALAGRPPFLPIRAAESADRYRRQTLLWTAAALAPPLDYLLLPAVLPRPDWLPDAGLILCAFAVLFLLRAQIDRECWSAGDGLQTQESRLRPEPDDPAALRLEFAGALLLSGGISLGFGSLVGLLLWPALLLSGLPLRKVGGFRHPGETVT